MNNLEKAIVLATTAHALEGQLDKGGTSYILHPLRVMLQMRTEAEMIAAVLHDAVEDTYLTLDHLRREGFPAEVIDAVDCLTKRKGESYDNFIQRVKTNPLARKVKLADLKDNMDVTRIDKLVEKDMRRLNKYLPVWRALLEN